MATEKRQRVRFTGKRTGLEAIAIKGVGMVEQGQQIEVSQDEAERWSAPLPMRDGKEGSDWVTVGEPFSVKEDEVPAREEAQHEKLAAKAAAELTETGPTVEDYVEARADTDKAEEAAKPKAKGG